MKFEVEIEERHLPKPEGYASIAFTARLGEVFKAAGIPAVIDRPGLNQRSVVEEVSALQIRYVGPIE